MNLRDIEMKVDKKNILIFIGVVIFMLIGTFYMRAMRQPAVLIQTALPQELPEIIVEEDSNEDAIEETKWIQIYVTGAVTNSGLYTLEDGKRIGDAIEAAGGMTEDAAIGSINLAAFLNDEQHIIVRTITEANDRAEQELAATAFELSQPKEEKININTATAADLTQLPGIGDVLSKSIVAYRDSNGFFKRIDDIKNVPRIGERLFEAIQDLIVVK